MSIIVHPFVTTLLLVAVVELRRGPSNAVRSVAAVALLLVLPLAVLMLRQVRRGRWGTVDASHPRERPALYAVGGAALLALLAYLAATSPDSPLVRGAGGTLAMVAVCGLATVWIKVSLHVAVAALAATVLLQLGSPVGWVLAVLLPLLAWSRVTMGRHRWREVAAGSVIGAIAGVMIVRL